MALKDFMLKSNKAKANIIDQSHLNDGAHSGIIDLGTLGITGRQVDLIKPKQESEDKRGVLHAGVITFFNVAHSFHRVTTEINALYYLICLQTSSVLPLVYC